MKVILQQDVKGQGKKGQMVEVSDGYARNFLLPRKLAVSATADNINTMKQQEKARKAQEAAEKAQAEATAKQLEGLMVKITAKAGEGGRLFGAVTAKEISEALAEQHQVEIAKTKLVLDEPIKACGGYQIRAKLGYEVVVRRGALCRALMRGPPTVRRFRAPKSRTLDFEFLIWKAGGLIWRWKRKSCSLSSSPILWRRSRPCWAPCSSTPAVSRM